MKNKVLLIGMVLFVLFSGVGNIMADTIYDDGYQCGYNDSINNKEYVSFESKPQQWIRGYKDGYRKAKKENSFLINSVSLNAAFNKKIMKSDILENLILNNLKNIDKTKENAQNISMQLINNIENLQKIEYYGPNYFDKFIKILSENNSDFMNQISKTLKVYIRNKIIKSKEKNADFSQYTECLTKILSAEKGVFI